MKKYLVIVALVVVILAGWYFFKVKNYSNTAVPPGQTTSVPIGSSSPQGTTRNTSQPTLSYGEAVNRYANRRIQFNELCQAIPDSLHIINGQSVMFDNRSSHAVTLSVDGVHYSLPGYGFRIIQLTHSKLPYTARIDCSSGKNNARITLE